MSLDTSQAAPGSAGALSPPVDRAEAVRPPTAAKGKTTRRPLLFALMAALVAAGALLAGWAYTTVSDTHEVLAVRETVHRGETITREDLVTVQVGIDPALTPVSSAELANVVGKRAAVDLSAGSLLTQEAITETVLPAAGDSMVGISLTPAQRPSQPLYQGDRVRIIATPGDQGEVTTSSPESVPAEVVGVRRIPETGETVVDVSLPHQRASELAARASTGRVALVLDSREH